MSSKDSNCGCGRICLHVSALERSKIGSPSAAEGVAGPLERGLAPCPWWPKDPTMLNAGAVGARQMSGTGIPAGGAAEVVTGRMAAPRLTGSALTAAEWPPTQAWLPWTAG